MLKIMMICAVLLGIGTLAVSAADHENDGRETVQATYSSSSPITIPSLKAEQMEDNSAFSSVPLMRSASSPISKIAGYTPETFHVGSLRWFEPDFGNPLFNVGGQ